MESSSQIIKSDSTTNKTDIVYIYIYIYILF